MEIVETQSEGLTRGFKIKVEAAELSARQEARLADIGRDAQISGFRPGKVPLKILKQRFGQAILGEVLEATVQEAAQKTMEDRGLRPAGQPKIDAQEFKEDQDFEYEMTVEVLPEIEPGDFSTYEFERMTVAPADDEVDKSISQIAAQRRQSEPISGKRAAKSGDLVVLDYAGSVDGTAFDGGTGEGFQLELGSGQFIPGFEAQVEGQKVDQQFDVTVTFPEDYTSEELAGKEAVFSCKINEIRELSEAKIDDEFAKELGLDDLATLRDQVRQQLEQEYQRLAREKLKRSLLDRLADQHEFEVPPSMAETEFQSIWQQIEEAKESGKLEGEDAAKSDEDLRAEYDGIARRRVRLGLLLSEIGHRNNISVSQDEVNRALMQVARQYPGHEQEVISQYQQAPEAMQQLQAPIFEDKVVDYILEIAKVTDRAVSREELLAEDTVSAESEAVAKKKGAKKAPTKAKTAATPVKKAAAKKPAKAKTATDKGTAKKKTAE